MRGRSWYGQKIGGRSTAKLKKVGRTICVCLPSDAALSARIQEHGSKPTTAGIAADAAGNLYLTAIEHDPIWVMKSDGS